MNERAKPQAIAAGRRKKGGSRNRELTHVDHREWLAGIAKNKKALKKYLRDMRRVNAAWLLSTNDNQRALAEWFCSEQWLMDQIDTASCLDYDGSGVGRDAFGGGPPVMHPDYGPRRTQEDLRELVRSFREAISSTFICRRDLEIAYLECSTMMPAAEDPQFIEQWGNGWADRHWVAWLYKAGMQGISASQYALRDVPNWAHAFSMAMGAQESLRAISDVSQRSKLLRASRFLLGRPKGRLGVVATLIYSLAPEVETFEDLILLLEQYAQRRMHSVEDVDTSVGSVVIAGREVRFKTIRNHLSRAKNPGKR